MQKKLDALVARFIDVEQALSLPDVFSDQEQYRSLTKEHSYLSKIVSVIRMIQQSSKELEDARSLTLLENDEQMKELLRQETIDLEQRIASLDKELQLLLVPPDPSDDYNVIIELRAGTGGDEAALFVADCVRMYQLYAAEKGWECEPLSFSESELGGFKEYIMAMSGQQVNRLMQYEGGIHRVQRVPATEAQGRVHTSAITVAIMPEPTKEEAVTLDEKDLRIDTYRSSGAGGQHVNTTDSAVRITHIPTGVVAYCSEERSQHKNRDKAIRLLKAKIADERRRQRDEAEAAARAKQVGSGDRSERIRTYNFPQNRLTDHRINLTIYHLDRVMQGNLDEVTSALVTYFHQLKLVE